MPCAVLNRVLSPRLCYRCVSTLRERLVSARVSKIPSTVFSPRKRRQLVRRSSLTKETKEVGLESKQDTVQNEYLSTSPGRISVFTDYPEDSTLVNILGETEPLNSTKRRRRKKPVLTESDDAPEDKEPSSVEPPESDPTANVVDIEAPEKISVPRLAHGLDRVLFNPGVYYLQDPRSNVYNFDPYLQEITPVKDFNFDALTEYITSSRDPTLDELARSHGLTVVGSTSSMTGVLSQFHYFISSWRPVSLRRLSTAFQGKSQKFTAAQRAPASIYLRHNDGIYAIDADKSLDSGETVLSFLGRSMEKMLTLDQEEFSKLKKENSAEAPTEKSREAYHYSKLGSMLMRSQLDCNDPRLPGSGIFDLKTRAVLPVRMDVKNAHEGAGYQIHQSMGLLESFEREYYDMIRSAFLKYSLQVRIGKMDGIFVAYHNTERIFGFQYVSLEEMDENVHGSSDRNIATREFIMSLKQLDRILGIAIKKYPGQSMALCFETSESKTPEMTVVIEPLEEEEIKRRQNGELLDTLKAAQKNERIRKMPSSEASTNSKGTLESMSSTLEKIISKGKKKSVVVQQDISALASTTEVDQQPIAAVTRENEGEPKHSLDSQEGVLKERTMLQLAGSNFIDGKPVKGPPEPSLDSLWQFKFTVKEITSGPQIDKKLRSMVNKQAQAFTDIYEDERRPQPFKKDLKRMSELGRLRLEELKERQPDTPVIFRDHGGNSRDLEREYRKNFL